MPEAAEQKIGNVGSASESFAAGIAKASVAADLPPMSFGLKASVQVNLELDSSALIEFLAKKIGGPVPAEVASFLEMALKAI